MRFIDFVFRRSVLKLCDVLSYIKTPRGYGSELVYPVHFPIFSDFGCVCIRWVIVYDTDDLKGYFMVMMCIHMSRYRFVSIMFYVCQMLFDSGFKCTFGLPNILFFAGVTSDKVNKVG